MEFSNFCYKAWNNQCMAMNKYRWISTVIRLKLLPICMTPTEEQICAYFSRAVAMLWKPLCVVPLLSQWITRSVLLICRAFDNIRAPKSPIQLPLPSAQWRQTSTTWRKTYTDMKFCRSVTSSVCLLLSAITVQTVCHTVIKYNMIIHIGTLTTFIFTITSATFYLISCLLSVYPF